MRNHPHSCLPARPHRTASRHWLKRLVGFAATLLVASSLSLTGVASIASAADTASISGVLTSAGVPAQPVGSGSVLVFRADGSFAGTALTTVSGSYSVTGLAVGSYTLQFNGGVNSGLVEQWWNQKATQSSAVYFALGAGEAASGFDAQLLPGATVSGRVLSGTTPAAGVAGSNVLIMDRSGAVVGSTVSASDGGFSVGGLAAGSVTIDARVPFNSNYLEQWWNGKPSFATADFFSVLAGETLIDRNITLPSGATISGSVVTRAALPVPLVSATVSAFGPDGTIQNQGTTDQSGNYTIVGLASGPYRILFQSAESDNFGTEWWRDATSISTAVVVEVGAGQAIVGIDGALGVGATISGTVSRADGGALPDYFIEPIDAAGQPVPAITGVVNGVYSISHLAPGSYTLHTVSFSGDLAEQWWDNSPSLAGATYFPVPPGATLTGFDVTLYPTGIVGSTPTISGAATVGQTLTAQAGAWGPAPVSLSYRWNRDGIRIHGANRSQYELTDRDAGHTLTVTVTGSKRGFAPTSATSAPTALVTGGHLRPSIPHISGPARHGETLTMQSGSWGPGQVTLVYSWSRNGQAIAGATASTYALTGADVGAAITVTVTGSELGFTVVSRTSRPCGRIR